MTQVNVRYIVDDMDESIAFYTEVFGFQVDMHPGPSFSALSRAWLRDTKPRSEPITYAVSAKPTPAVLANDGEG